jgi:hypothetical protein
MFLTRCLSKTRVSRQDVATVVVGDDKEVLLPALREGTVRTDHASAGWYYKQDGQTCGPVSIELQELLTTGRLQPRQVVWKQGARRLLFVHAATAAFTGRSPSAERLTQPVPT